MDQFLLAVLAGVLIAIAGYASACASYGIADPWTAKLISALVFPCGLCMVVAMGAELFTGNCLLVTPLLARRCSLAAVLRNWILVYAGNFAGSAAVALAVRLICTNPDLQKYLARLADAKCALAFPDAFVLGVLCNVLVTLAVLMSYAGKGLAGTALPVFCFVLCGFEHSVADMFYVPAGMLFGGGSMQGFLSRCLLPVTLGNTAGGALVGWLVWHACLKGRCRAV